MKIAILQLNFLVGDLVGNANKIMESYKQAVDKGADLVVSTELALFGYPPKDMLLIGSYITRHNQELNRIKKIIGTVPLILGIVQRNHDRGKPLFNSVAMIENGKIIATEQKTLLPTYDVFDEHRYFESKINQKRKTVTYLNRTIGFLICEDVWVREKETQHTYQRNPVEELSKLSPDIVIIINGSPYCWGKGDVRRTLISTVAQKLSTTVVYANQIGGNDDLVFDGRSFVVNPQGQLMGQAASFKEEILIVDTDIEHRNTLSQETHDSGDLAELYQALILGIKDYFGKIGVTNGAVIGLSGGIDSALTAVIAAQALGKHKVLGVGMPSEFSSQGSIDDARQLADNLGIEFMLIPIKPGYKVAEKMLKPFIDWHLPGTNKADVTEENIQARLRGLILMAISNRTGKMVISTGNKSEIAVGYCTLYGDMVGGFAAISDVPKTLVYQLAHYINRDREVIPKSSIIKSPSAELAPGQKDQDSLPPYEILDPILKAYIEDQKGIEDIVNLGFDQELVEKIITRVNGNEYKRKQMTIGPKVTTKAFGSGRRWPIAAKR